MNKHENAEIVVIGGGAVGTAVACYLARDGADVALVERGEYAWGSSRRCDGHAVTYDSAPGYFSQFCKIGQDMFPEISRELPCDIEFEPEGLGLLVDDERDMETVLANYEGKKNEGVDVTFWDSDELLRHDPHDSDKVIAAIDRGTDVDGFHPLNVASLWLRQECLLPCTPKGIIRLLKSTGTEIAGKRAVVIGRSNIVGLPVAKLLLDENATVTIAHSRTKNLPEVTREADILVVAIGRPKFVTADMVKPGAVVIDVGVNRDPETGKLCGDVDFAACEPVAGMITKVPGGVGPMTITILLENTIEAFERRMRG